MMIPAQVGSVTPLYCVVDGTRRCIFLGTYRGCDLYLYNDPTVHPTHGYSMCVVEGSDLPTNLTIAELRVRRMPIQWTLIDLPEDTFVQAALQEALRRGIAWQLLPDAKAAADL